MEDRYALELLLTDLFSKCDSHDDLMEMYSDCMRVVQHIESKRSNELQAESDKIKLELGRWCNELY